MIRAGLSAPDAFGLAILHRDREVAAPVSESLGQERLDKISFSYFRTSTLHGATP